MYNCLNLFIPFLDESASSPWSKIFGAWNSFSHKMSQSKQTRRQSDMSEAAFVEDKRFFNGPAASSSFCFFFYLVLNNTIKRKYYSRWYYKWEKFSPKVVLNYGLIIQFLKLYLDFREEFSYRDNVVEMISGFVWNG